MAVITDQTKRRALMWLFDRRKGKEPEGPHEGEGHHHQHTWWRVMCLTGVDYFSTLGYQPGIAFLAAGALSPLAAAILVLLTLFGALPIYGRVAEESPHGEGSISMLAHLLPRWKGKLMVLVLLGFVATDFIITITLSAADATAHIVENPFVEHHLQFLHHKVIVTLVLVAVLGAVFLKGFKEAIGIAVVLVIVYLSLNVVVAGASLYEVFSNPTILPNWKDALFAHPQVHGNPLLMIGISLLLFPKLALGLSGFETGVAVMPLVKGDRDLTAEEEAAIHATQSPSSQAAQTVQEILAGRIHNTKKLLRSAALIMSVMLLASSLVTTVLIPADKFCPVTGDVAIEFHGTVCPPGQKQGEANGRAIAYLAHKNFGDVFGTFYDLSTILILWFAGASAMAGLLNIVPRYLPRYGMAPDWARATRPLVLVFTAIAFAVTIWFQADVDAQGGAYATGVLVLMTSAAVAVTISSKRRGEKRWVMFLIISLVFAYTTIVNIFERTDGIKIASFFIGAIILISLISRAYRSTELRVNRVTLDEEAKRFIAETQQGVVRIVTNRMETGTIDEYEWKEKEKRDANHIPASDPILFFEVAISDASEFSGKLHIRGERVGKYRILRTESPVVPNAIAALMLHLRDKYLQDRPEPNNLPHVYFGWSEGNPITYLLKFIAFGEGDTAPVTHEVLRQAEKVPERRPIVHVGG